jgi:hypothetical protein
MPFFSANGTTRCERAGFSNPQIEWSCMTCAAFGSPRVPVSCCKTDSSSAVTVAWLGTSAHHRKAEWQN